ncbi:Alpha-ribazole-5'-phosphate phosphatase [Acidisarcina polymorpha]|uniref:Alpha-ribazole-5'-phosphate phosphatase n=1 Tax=Acidisarcina polymorpha TaxID=2211140 RepID=A0A2Z5G6U6_9BACT|nr:histidine phosphatase family protein [Acidisarcina polymorpha]AXC14404.1 Alpha-ribazole-5'-phosphate phosphatase [Acidisarcina polymorpha]
MNDLLFIRHAETDMAGTFCGHSDPALNDDGFRQVERLLHSLRSERIDAVYSSDLQRCHTTARALAETHAVPCFTSRGLREIHFGLWEGLTWQQIETLDSNYAARWVNEFPQLSAPQGESIESFERRVCAETENLLHRLNSGLLAVVTHAGVIRSVLRLLCGVDGTDSWARSIPYCSTLRYFQSSRSFQEVLL